MKYGAIRGTDDDDVGSGAGVGASAGAASHDEDVAHAWLVLVTLTLFTTGSHYFRHSFSGLGPALMSELGVKRIGFGALFSLEQLPGVVLPALGGSFLLYLPLSGTAVALAAMLLLSSAWCAFAVDRGSYLGLAWGRALFGAAEGVMATLQGALIARTFRARRVTTAFGAMLLVSRTSSFAGFVLPPLLLARSLSTAMWFGAGVLLIPFAATLVHFRLRRAGTGTTTKRANTTATATEAATVAAAAIRAIARLRVPFWSVAYMWASVACGVFTFAHFAPDAFSDVPGISTLAASLLSGTLFLVAGILSLIMGALADRLGRRPALLMLAALCETMGLVLCAYGGATRSSAMAILGMALLTACLCIAPVILLASVAITVPPQALPLALGVYKSVENLGLAFVHLAVGALRDVSGDYVLSVLALAVVAVSAIPGVLLMAKMAPETSQQADIPNPRISVQVDQVGSEL